VALVVGWVMLGRYAFDAQRESFVLASVVCAVIALIASADVFALFQTALQFVAEPLGDRYYYRLDHFLPGAYLWWASQIALCSVPPGCSPEKAAACEQQGVPWRAPRLSGFRSARFAAMGARSGD